MKPANRKSLAGRIKFRDHATAYRVSMMLEHFRFIVQNAPEFAGIELEEQHEKNRTFASDETELLWIGFQLGMRWTQDPEKPKLYERKNNSV